MKSVLFCMRFGIKIVPGGMIAVVFKVFGFSFPEIILFLKSFRALHTALRAKHRFLSGSRTWSAFSLSAFGGKVIW